MSQCSEVVELKVVSYAVTGYNDRQLLSDRCFLGSFPNGGPSGVFSLFEHRSNARQYIVASS